MPQACLRVCSAVARPLSRAETPNQSRCLINPVICLVSLPQACFKVCSAVQETPNQSHCLRYLIILSPFSAAGPLPSVLSCGAPTAMLSPLTSSTGESQLIITVGWEHTSPGPLPPGNLICPKSGSKMKNVRAERRVTYSGSATDTRQLFNNIPYFIPV